MGAWAEKGYDNDSACDWLDGFIDTISFNLLHAFFSRWREEGIAAAQLLTELPEVLKERLGRQIFAEALEVVDSELKSEVIKLWKRPERRKRYLVSLRSRLQTVLDRFGPPSRKHSRYQKSRSKGPGK